jgi:hypothetical protein
MLSDEQIAVLCDIGQSVAFSDDRQGLVQQLVIGWLRHQKRRPL